MLTQRVFYSVGGGFVVDHNGSLEGTVTLESQVPYPLRGDSVEH